MHNRMKKARTIRGFTLTKTAELIGISDSAYSKLEKGINNPSDRTVMLFCQKLRISESWLRTGEGEMEERDVIAELIAAYDLGPAAQALMRAVGRILAELGEEACNRAIEDVLAELQASLANRQMASVSNPQSPADEESSSASSGSVIG